MAWFRCSIEGENFPLTFDGTRSLLGFFTTRWVEATTPEDAERRCVELLRMDPALAHERTDGARPVIFVREIEEIVGSPPKGPGSGFTFFPMES